MPGHVGQRLTDHRQEVLADLVRDDGVDGSLAVHGRLETQRTGGLGGEGSAVSAGSGLHPGGGRCSAKMLRRMALIESSSWSTSSTIRALPPPHRYAPRGH